VSKLSSLKSGCIAFILCAAAAVTASAQTLTTLVNFSGSNGNYPTAPVIQATDSNFYGTTNLGGTNTSGTVFKMTPTGTFTTLYSFCSQQSCADGEYPNAGLLQASDGNLYGTTSDGGAHGTGGTVFKITPSGNLTTIYSFCSVAHCADGQSPNTSLIQGIDGNFYGTTFSDGVNSAGTVFQLTPSGTLTTIYHFCSQSGCTDGAKPDGLLQTSDGTLYGTTLYGGVGTTFGTVFKLTTSGALTTLWSFCTQSNCTDGQQPLAGLVLGSDGLFYGTTSLGGSNNFGTVFKISSSGTFTLLHGFQQSTDGSQSYGPLVQAVDGNYYGSTRTGGTHAAGTLFEVTPGGALTTLYDFCSGSGCSDGGQPLAGLKYTRGNFYGTTSTGGSANDGTVFSFPAPAPSPVQFTAITPCRLLDTRSPNGGGPIQGGTFQTYNLPQLSQSACNLDLSTAKTYSLNVTLVPIDNGPVSYLTIWPAGQSQPVVSLMNSLDGRIKANAAIVPAGTSGGVSIYVTNTTNVVVDIDGYFTTPGGSTLQFYTLTPCRVADTRSSNYPQGLGTPNLSAGTARDFPVLSSPCLQNITNAAAYSFNLTAVPYQGSPLYYLEVWPTGAPPANPVSTLNNTTVTYVANAAIVPAGSDGKITAYPSNNTDLVIDINGYFAPPGGQGALSLYPAIPCRVYDSRKVGSGQPFTGTLDPPVDVVDGTCGVPDSAKAYVFNTTVVPTLYLSYLTLWPDGTGQPVVSTLNAADGFITSNMAIVPNVDGDIDAYAAGMTQLILDLSAYFAP
jgi:uncharacterized repeat protein (TIGR03803 family)